MWVVWFHFKVKVSPWCLDKLRFVLNSTHTHTHTRRISNWNWRSCVLLFYIVMLFVRFLTLFTCCFEIKMALSLGHMSYISLWNQNWKWRLGIVPEISYVCFVMRIILCQGWSYIMGGKVYFCSIALCISSYYSSIFFFILFPLQSS